MKLSKAKLAAITLAVVGALLVATAWYRTSTVPLRLRFLYATNDASGLAVCVFRLENRTRETVISSDGYLKKQGALGWVTGYERERFANLNGEHRFPPGGDNVFRVFTRPNERLRLVLHCVPEGAVGAQYQETRWMRVVRFISSRLPGSSPYQQPLNRWRMSFAGVRYPASGFFRSSPSNPQGGANGRQPLSSDTNRTSLTAASRRSP